MAYSVDETSREANMISSGSTRAPKGFLHLNIIVQFKTYAGGKI